MGLFWGCPCAHIAVVDTGVRHPSGACGTVSALGNECERALTS
ncbi:unnamed protein product [Ixodes pacificus]